MNEKEIKGETALVVRVQQIAEEANRTLEQSSAKGVAKDAVDEWTATWEVLRRAWQFLPDDKKRKKYKKQGRKKENSFC